MTVFVHPDDIAGLHRHREAGNQDISHSIIELDDDPLPLDPIDDFLFASSFRLLDRVGRSVPFEDDRTALICPQHRRLRTLQVRHDFLRRVSISVLPDTDNSILWFDILEERRARRRLRPMMPDLEYIRTQCLLLRDHVLFRFQFCISREQERCSFYKRRVRPHSSCSDHSSHSL